MKRNEGKEVRRSILRLALAVFYSIGCITVTMCLYYIREKQSDLLLKTSSDTEWGKQSDLVLETSPDIEWENHDVLLSEKREELKTLREELQLLQIKYDLQKLVKEKYDEADPRSKYEKYFHIEQGELARIERIEDLQTCGTFGFLNGHFSGVIFEISEGIQVQYSNAVTGSVWESYKPNTLIITDAEPNLGFMGARAGMNFAEIQKNALPGEIRQGFMYFYEAPVYYMEYQDAFYQYTFLSDHEDGSGSWMLVNYIY
ncbi:MAG: hypothetical protein K2O40_06975 [Lachnospiraceae bacterium]|nr:hypothetical protein [Lachnospiraceae bacterium]